jgi:hypothetical protein
MVEKTSKKVTKRPRRLPAKKSVGANHVRPATLTPMSRGELEALVLQTARSEGFPEVVAIVLELYPHRRPNWEIARVSTSVANTYDLEAIRSQAQIRALQERYSLGVEA